LRKRRVRKRRSGSGNKSGPGRAPVIQREPTGCGIASVAAIARVSYARVRTAAAALGIRASDETLWSKTEPVRRLLRQFGWTARGAEAPFRSWNALPDLALLAIKWHRVKGKAYWHWVVFVREGEHTYVLDSKRSLRRHIRTDFGRMKPKWYIRVVR